MDSKKSAARAAKDVRASTSSARNTERSQILSKRPSAPPTELAAKKRASLPPQAPDNDNAPRGKTLAAVPSKPPAAMPSKPPVSGMPGKPMVPSIPRGRLPTGSLHTEARTPAQAESIKQRLTTLMNTQQKLVEMKRSHQKHFAEIGELLHRVREQRLFEVKGYSTFESFIEREVNLSQSFCLHAVRIFETFLPAAVQQYGFARLAAAVDALDQNSLAPAASAGNESLRMARSPIPPHKL
ncbi:MAG TPA: hypothetical protein VFX59_10580 [Polyangiales bacterium]|nr:hypothetical protein [Polyangiales bacterium]